MINSHQGQRAQDGGGDRHQPQLGVARHGFLLSHHQHADPRRITEPGVRHVGDDRRDAGRERGAKLLADPAGVGDVNLGRQGHHYRPDPARVPWITHQQLTSDESGRDVTSGPHGQSPQDRLAATQPAAGYAASTRYAERRCHTGPDPQARRGTA